VGEAQFDHDDVFDEDYLYFFAPRLEQSRDGDAKLIWDLLGIRAGATVLDLACGHGRISNRLACRGANVSGLDSTRLFLEQARAEASQARLQVDYVEGDMRALPWPDGSFDHVISWFTSFGYFDDDQNQLLLREVSRVLRGGGTLLIEGNNLAQLLPRWLPAVVVERDGNFVIDRSSFDPTTGRATTERVVIRDGRTRRFIFSVRMFIAVELRGWLLRAGFRHVDFFGEDGDRLNVLSRRMIAIARR
jgi:SAM-dependent methyltransferase